MSSKMNQKYLNNLLSPFQILTKCEFKNTFQMNPSLKFQKKN